MCKAALERFTTGLAAEASNDKIGVERFISPASLPPPGVLHHKLVNGSDKDMATPVEHMAEACLHLVHGDPSGQLRHITYAADVLGHASPLPNCSPRSPARVKVQVALSPGPPLTELRPADTFIMAKLDVTIPERHQIVIPGKVRVWASGFGCATWQARSRSSAAAAKLPMAPARPSSGRKPLLKAVCRRLQTRARRRPSSNTSNVSHA
ncbi:hypothetical protein [Candidatus Amarobacter glycogenicus]|uniref:hypothetical protein n=1 Tax=Candidatus Amarobacter glycogenicus TaxID=3140699 RepID=UPI0031CCBCF7